MALTESPTTDDAFFQLRSESRARKDRCAVLSSAILSSTRIQEQLQQRPSLDSSLTRILGIHVLRNNLNTHRLAYGVTAFPYRDPSPDNASPELLGIRFDIPSYNGTFETPYYILLSRLKSDEDAQPATTNAFRVHRHTIPALVPIDTYPERDLSDRTDFDYDLGSAPAKQDLETFTRAVRSSLVSWHLRKDIITLLQQKLELETVADIRSRQTAVSKKNAADSDSVSMSISDAGDTPRTSSPVPQNTSTNPGRFGVTSLQAVSYDANYVRIIWSSGRVARLKILNDGSIEKAVVIGDTDGRDTRDLKAERFLLGGDGRIDSLDQRLKEIWQSENGAKKVKQ